MQPTAATMKIPMKIALMKSETKDEDPYPAILSRFGHAETLPVLKFRFFNLPELTDCLSRPEAWSGIIFTSPRAVDTASQCSWDHSIWQKLPCYTVGGATARAATAVGFQCYGESTGNGEKLANFIVERVKLQKTTTPEVDGVGSSKKPLLFVSGVLKRDELPSILSANGVSFETLDCYETLPSPDVDEVISSYVTRNGIPTHVVFFSPSSYKFSFDSWKHILSTHFGEVTFVAIGSTTLKSFSGEIQQPLCAQKPSPESLFEILKP